MRQIVMMILVLANLSLWAQVQSKYKFKSDNVVKMYSLLMQPEASEKLYSYRSCFKMDGDKIVSVDQPAAEAYLKYIKGLGIFTEGYVKDERKWIESITKDLEKKGTTDELVSDKYYGENPEAVKKDIAAWFEKWKRDRTNPAVNFSSTTQGGKGKLTTAFYTAKYSMKYGIALSEPGSDNWLVDSITQK